ncbi:MAG: hypothetical protein M1834_004191 [Cirrosporium novae-zelandiae]|nr:MAG: hypothetical protein M1834_004191 [Cirrosporium novae-zelandiae]
MSRDLHIELNSSPTIASSSTVSGRVIFSSQKDEAVGRITVAFLGRCKTKIYRSNGQNRTTYRGRAQLFSFSQILYEGHYTLRTGQYEWPFEFIVPEYTQGPGEPWSERPGFNTNAVQLLPPSMTFKYRGFATNTTGFISYELHARMDRPADASIFSTGKNSSMLLQYLPSRGSQHPEPEIRQIGTPSSTTFRCHSLYLLPEKQGQPLSFKEKTKSIFMKSDLPCSVFQMSLVAPHVVYGNGPLPILAEIIHQPGESTAPEIPAVYIESCTVTLKSRTHSRARAYFSDNMQDDFTDKFTLASKADMHLLLPAPTGQVSLSESLPLLRLDQNFIPTFQTYNISREYMLDISLHLTCAGKTFKMECMSALLILPTLYKGDIEALNGGNLTQVMEEALPAYSPAEHFQDSDTEDEKLPAYKDDRHSGERVRKKEKA